MFAALSHNDVLVGLATLGGLIGLALIVFQVVRTVWKWTKSVYNDGWLIARRAYGRQQALLAYRCAENPSYFIATIIQDSIVRFMMVFIILDTIYSSYRVYDLTNEFSLYDGVVAAASIIIFLFTVFGYFMKFYFLSMNVKRVIVYRKWREGHRSAAWRKPMRHGRSIRP